MDTDFVRDLLTFALLTGLDFVRDLFTLALFTGLLKPLRHISMSKRKGEVMPNIGAKRKRDPTFGASEKLTLISLVEQHFDIVESKKTDAVSMRQKAEEWRKLAETFNATSSIHPREPIVLKNCWENLKKKAKQELTQRNQSFMATG